MNVCRDPKALDCYLVDIGVLPIAIRKENKKEYAG
tara:strand:+ start:253 stop:357 length:105 start_codon:yes stop_codon:yes gene_type:complete